MDLHKAGKQKKMELAKLEEWKRRHTIEPRFTRGRLRDGMRKE
jgi:hypothetical protein